MRFESLEPRALLSGQPITINFADLSNLPAPNTVSVGGWINAGQAVASTVQQVATVQIGTGVTPAPPAPTPSSDLTITPNTSVYHLDQALPAPLVIGGTNFGSVPTANIITFYEDAAGTTPSPVNPNGAAGPFHFSISAGDDTSLTVAFSTTPGQQPNAGPLYAKITSTWAYPLQADGTFAATASPRVPFFEVAHLTDGISFDQVTNGNDRLFFVVTPTPPAPTSSAAPWQNFPVTVLPANTATVPPGPFGFLEFGYDAQFNTSYVDSFGLNWSFVDDAAPTVVYGAAPTVSRSQMQSAYPLFTAHDPLGGPFAPLLWTATTSPVPAAVDGQFTAIVSPKDWIADPPAGQNIDALTDYWTATVDAFFTSGNQLNIRFNGSVYSGTSDGAKYTLNPSTDAIVIEKSMVAGANIFSQPQPDNSPIAGQLKSNIFEAFSRGVALDGVWKHDTAGSPPDGYSSAAWTNYPNWYTPGPTTYDPTIARTYDVYAKFFHYATADGADFRTVPNGQPLLGKNPAGLFAMAYGFSLDESPSLNTNPALGFAGNAWPADATVNGGTTIPAGGSITVTFGPWSSAAPVAPTVVSLETNPAQQGTTPTHTTAASVEWIATFSEPVRGVTAANFSLVVGAGLSNASITAVTAHAGSEPSRTWIVSAETGSGAGTLRLDIVNGSGITDAEDLAPTGLPFTGQTYDVDRSVAPSVRIPPSFWAQPERRANLVWPRRLLPFPDPANRELTVTLAATGGDGTFAARTGIRGITVTGTGSGPEISLTGTAKNLNAYFRTAGRLRYTPSGESLLPRVLTVSAATTTGGPTGADTAAILVRSRRSPGRPTLDPQVGLGATPAGTPLEIAYETLLAAANVPAATTQSIQFMLGRISGGALESWDGAEWVPIRQPRPRLARTFRQPLLAPGGRIRWTPPAEMSGELPAFTMKVWDGRLISAVAAQVSVPVSPA